MIIGVDEVGRGAWAGPMLVCAVALSSSVNGLTDSKKLTKQKRQLLAKQITDNNPVGYGWVSASEIDDFGLSLALKIAAAKALQDVNYNNQPIIVDGNIQFYDLLKNSAILIKADLKEPSVSAASIVAKVTRDSRMQQYALIYPGYNLEQNVGYGTTRHKKAIQAHGLTPIHRKSYKII